MCGRVAFCRQSACWAITDNLGDVACGNALVGEFLLTFSLSSRCYFASITLRKQSQGAFCISFSMCEAEFLAMTLLVLGPGSLCVRDGNGFISVAALHHVITDLAENGHGQEATYGPEFHQRGRAAPRDEDFGRDAHGCCSDVWSGRPTCPMTSSRSS